MTYNIKNSWQDYDSWIDRRLTLINQIKSVNPDLIGLQEADENWITYIKEPFKTSNTPSILTGDFNFIENSTLYKKTIKDSLSDSKYLAKDSISFGTINYFTNFHFKYMPAIDYILLSNDDFQVEKYQVLYQHKHNNKPISDHFPVLVDLNLKDSKKR
ncbi:MAG: endonuclease/exonuclease/phosphatase family protein [Firmicutes bacterium]|jgi:endonuclease/exonuclease/phosphatase family metal-dependent hydrolase|nr:endonuclease/exonuclease/phosphatase family protein [Bacillota bacterium]